MFYGVKQSTDLRSPNTEIRKFSSKSSLLKWMNKGSGVFTHDNPEAARNHHHDFKCGYELLGRIDKKDKIFKDHGSSTYPRNDAYNTVLYLYTYGKEVK